MWCHLFTKLASYKVPLVMVSTHGSVVPLAMFVFFCYLIKNPGLFVFSSQAQFNPGEPWSVTLTVGEESGSDEWFVDSSCRFLELIENVRKSF